MKKSQLVEILSAVEALTFTNPFSDERARIEEDLLNKFGDPPRTPRIAAPFSERFQTLLSWLELAEKEINQRAQKEGLPNEWKERAGYFAFFSLFHEVAENLDGIIREDASDTNANRKLFREIQEGAARRHFLIAGASERIWNQPEHLFACYYQLRRAFHAIHSEIIGESAPIQKLRMEIWESVFTKDMMSYQQWMFDSVGRFPTLILGPTGSGKELVARALGLSRFLPYAPKTGHFATNPTTSFHPVNLSAISSNLIESELFGHRKGAFTGATQDREGLFATAGNYGTVFLDEIGEVDEATQVKLLRILQSGDFQAVGETTRRNYNGKIIAATHKNLAAEMHAGRFREDFYYRLCGDQIHTVSLREILDHSPEELPRSVAYICRKLIGTEGSNQIAPRIVDSLNRAVPKDYDWPGNFRELEQAVRNCIVRKEYTPPQKEETDAGIDTVFQSTSVSLHQWSSLYAKQAYRNAGSYREAARRLDVDQRTLKKLVTEKPTS